MQLQRQLPDAPVSPQSMICAHCGVRTELSTCRSCGQSALLKGRYRLLDLVSGEPTAMEYRAVDVRRPDKPLLLRLRPIMGNDPREADAIAAASASMRAMDHPAVQSWLDVFLVGSDEGKTLCVFTEEPDGARLSSELLGEPWSISRVVSTLDELLGVAVHVHAMSPAVALSNLDPRRILRRRDGSLLLTHAAPLALRQRGVGAAVCEAPEHRRGQWSPAADIYAIAALGVGLLLGKAPDQLADPGGFLVWASAAERRGPIVPMLTRWLSPDPAARPATAKAALNELRALVEGPSNRELESRSGLDAAFSLQPGTESSFTYGRIEQPTDGSRAARRALDRTTDVRRALERNTDVRRALDRSTDITRIQPVVAQSTPEDIVAQSTLGARMLTIGLTVTFALAAVLAVQSTASRMGWIQGDPWVDGGKGGRVEQSSSALRAEPN